MISFWLALGALSSAPSWKIGIWMERRTDLDSLQSRRWADSLVSDFGARTRLDARLEVFALVPAGILPLAGGSARFHPDLRQTQLDLQWGVPFRDTLGPALARTAQRTWLASRGCPQERQFSVGWDMFLLPKDPRNRPDSALWKLDATHWVHVPTWRILPDSGLDPYCQRLVNNDPPTNKLRFPSDDTLRRRLARSLSGALSARARDHEGRPAVGARLELWRSRPNPLRPFAALLEGLPDTLRSDTAGRFPIHRAIHWFTSDSLQLGREGSNLVTYWRVSLGKKRLEGWLDAVDLARRLDSGGINLEWTLASGSSRAWKEASDHWPASWLAAEADSSGTLTIGFSVVQETEVVLRLLDERGREHLRTRPLRFDRGVHERTLSPGLPMGAWDLRVDSPSQRWQIRFTQPPRRSSAAP
ncbi:MAG: hypothetical protein IPN71_05510 [Fibrobacteres bacterium]|nr:hypothetical protein [Fibrobacterota bacterium]